MEVVVIGGGAAGMIAAITSAKEGNSVTLIEKKSSLGNKVKITGKGRCNVANACDTEELFPAGSVELTSLRAIFLVC